MTTPQEMTIMQGDALQTMLSIPAGSVDAIITDPPYGLTAASWDAAPDWPEFFAACWRVLKPAGALIVFSAQPTAAELICLEKARYRYEWIWEKANAVGILNANRMPLRAHEHILVFYRKAPTWNKVPIPNQRGRRFRYAQSRHPTATYKSALNTGAVCEDGSRCPRSVVYYAREQHTVHPTQKPTALVRMLIEQYTLPGQLVLDPYMGSGTTLVAAAEVGRRGYGIELQADYVTIAQQRVADARARAAGTLPGLLRRREGTGFPVSFSSFHQPGAVPADAPPIPGAPPPDDGLSLISLQFFPKSIAALRCSILLSPY